MQNLENLEEMELLEELSDVQLTAVRGGGIGYAKVFAAYSDAAYAKYNASGSGGISNPVPNIEEINRILRSKVTFKTPPRPSNLPEFDGSAPIAAYDVEVGN